MPKERKSFDFTPDEVVRILAQSIFDETGITKASDVSISIQHNKTSMEKLTISFYEVGEEL